MRGQQCVNFVGNESLDVILPRFSGFFARSSSFAELILQPLQALEIASTNFLAASGLSLKISWASLTS